MPYVFDLDRLDRLAAEHCDAYRTADPYPHVVIDDFLDASAASELARVFPKPGDPVAWDHYAAPGLEVKLGCGDETRFPPPIREAIYQMNGGPFVRFLEKLTGVDHLLPDPHLFGGGMHLTKQGGLLGIHADFNWHKKLEAHRRLNLLLYLTPGLAPRIRRRAGTVGYDRHATRAQSGTDVQPRGGVLDALGYLPRPSGTVDAGPT